MFLYNRFNIDYGANKNTVFSSEIFMIYVDIKMEITYM